MLRAALSLGALTTLGACTSSEKPPATTPELSITFLQKLVAFTADLCAIEGFTPVQTARFFSHLMLATQSVLEPNPRLRVKSDRLSSAPSGLGSGSVADAIDVWRTLAPLLTPGVSPAFWDMLSLQVDELRQRFAGGRDGSAAATTRFVLSFAEWSQNDAYLLLRDGPLVMPSGEGSWVPTPPGFLRPVDSFCDRVVPLFLPSPMSLPLPPPPDFATSGDAPYRREALEVYRRGAKLTSSEDQMVRWWADGPYMSASPVGHWMLLGVEAARAQGTDPARALAVLSSLAVVMHDAAVSCFAWKFRFGTMRPVTYIRKYMDSKWTPALTTPPFPEYPSGHSVISGAAATVLERWLPLKEPIQDVLRNPMNESAPRTVTSWTAAATEASKSRILAGLHYRSAVERGQELGVAIAGAAQ